MSIKALEADVVDQKSRITTSGPLWENITGHLTFEYARYKKTVTLFKFQMILKDPVM